MAIRGSLTTTALIFCFATSNALADPYAVQVLIDTVPTIQLADEFVADLEQSGSLRMQLGDPLTFTTVGPARSQPPGVNIGALDPNLPEVVIRRAVSLTYNDTPPNRSQLQTVGLLQETGLFEHVELAPEYRFSYAISDPLYLNANSPNPNSRQWAIDALNLPAAFDRGTGRVMVAAVDSGLPGRVNEQGQPIDPRHPDLEPSSGQSSIRRHQSHLLFGSCDVPLSIERLVFPDDILFDLVISGHGTHVAGIISAQPNSVGVVGACPSCSFLMMRVLGADVSQRGCFERGVQLSSKQGASIINMSWGRGPGSSTPLIGAQVVAAMAARDIALFGATGNYGMHEADFPASSPVVTAVGAVAIDGGIIGTIRPWDEYLLRWNTADPSRPPASTPPYGHDSDFVQNPIACVAPLPPAGLSTPYYYAFDPVQCGTNRGPDVAAPGSQILSTIRVDYVPQGTLSVPAVAAPCTNRTDPLNYASASGAYGICTGTSMATPFVSAIAGLIRSASPLLSWQSVQQFLIASASRPAAYTAAEMGAGVPNADIAVTRGLGRVSGQVVRNRLTPMLAMYTRNSQIPPGFQDQIPPTLGPEAWIYSTTPQTAMAALLGELYFSSWGEDPQQTGINHFVRHFSAATHPSGPVGAAFPALRYAWPSPLVNAITPAQPPAASFHVFTGPKHPLSGTEGDLVPLYRLSTRCNTYRKHVYATAEGSPVQPGTRLYFENLSSNLCGGTPGYAGYDFDMVEGYVWRADLPGGPPAGSVALYRRYNSSVQAWALVLATELTHPAYAGYVDPGIGSSLLGYVYPNTDTDGDGLIDSWENLLGLTPTAPDSDGDGVADGDEFPLAHAQTVAEAGCPVGLDPALPQQSGCVDLQVSAPAQTDRYRVDVTNLGGTILTGPGNRRIAAVTVVVEVTITSASSFLVSVPNGCVSLRPPGPVTGGYLRVRCTLDQVVWGMPRMLEFIPTQGSSVPSQLTATVSALQHDTLMANNSIQQTYPAMTGGEPMRPGQP